MLLDARKKEEMKQRAKELYEFIAELEPEVSVASERIKVKKECRTCDHWDAGCGLAQFAAPPDEVQARGCEQWVEVDFLPF